MTTRTIKQLIRAHAMTEGAGVTVHRTIGTPALRNLDPFLMLDHFGSDDPDEYIAGFPDHPHRGFITFTYMLDGHMLHQDSMGNRGDLRAGGAQWMKAASGVIHSEMPQQTDGLMRGFQLWINLPAAEKMKPAAYRDIRPDEIPQASLPGGGEVRVIAGTIVVDGREVAGPVQGLSTEALYIDVRLPAGGRFTQAVAAGHNAFVYAYEGSLAVGPADDRRVLAAQDAGVLAAGEQVEIGATTAPARFLLLAARPLGEPVVQHGPFVMNTREEIEQAIADYRNNRLA